MHIVPKQFMNNPLGDDSILENDDDCDNLAIDSLHNKSVQRWYSGNRSFPLPHDSRCQTQKKP